MKLTFTLLAASLATSVSAGAYTLCCCTKHVEAKKSANPDLRNLNRAVIECDHDSTKHIVDVMYGHFAFSTHFWGDKKIDNGKTPRFWGDNYIYATGLNGDDNLIGAKEMNGWCVDQRAGRYCWTPDTRWGFNYKGEKNPGTKRSASP